MKHLSLPGVVRVSFGLQPFHQTGVWRVPPAPSGAMLAFAKVSHNVLVVEARYGKHAKVR